MKQVEVEIKGLSGLLQHRFGEAAEADSADSTRKALVVRGTPREEAAKCLYMDPGGALYHPSSAILRMLREVGAGHKMKGTRKSLKFIIPSAVFLMSADIPLLNGNGKPITEWEVDSRPVVIPSTKGRIMRHRPRHDVWSARFMLDVDELTLPVEKVHELLEEGGRKYGIGDYRPEKGGPFGRFEVTIWSVLKD